MPEKNDKKKPVRKPAKRAKKDETPMPEGFEMHPIAEEADMKELDEELSSIYCETDEKGRPTDMSRLDRGRGSLMRRITFGLVTFFALLAAVSWVGFFYFSPADDKFTGESVYLNVEGPTTVKSGKLVTFTVKYRNGENVPLGTSQLEVRLPESFVVQSTEPVTDDVSWNLGSLPPRSKGEVSVSGIFLAPIGKEHDLQAVVSYRPADFNSQFQKVSTKTVVIDGSTIELAADGPTKAMPGDTVDVTFEYSNDSDTRFEDLVLRADWPEGFIPEGSEPKATDEAVSEWRIDEIGPFGAGSVTVTGTFASDAYGDMEFDASLGYLDRDDSPVEQAETSLVTEVLQGQLVAALILNGKTDSQAVRFGETLRFAVSYRNTGKASLGNVEVSANFESQPPGGLLLWNELKDDEEGLLAEDTVTWTSKQVESLARLDGGGEGVIEFQVPLPDAPPGDVEDGEYEVRAWVETLVESVDGDVVNLRTRTQPMTIKMLSDAELSVGARFYDDVGIPVGSGKIPPEVGETTTYRVTWKVRNSLHELTDLKISARLPENVEWTGRSSVDAGGLEFDSADRRLTWTLNWLPTTVREVDISFDVALTPTDAQRGKIPTLVDAALFESTDKIAGYDLLISAPPVSTSLDGDSYGSGKGRVR